MGHIWQTMDKVEKRKKVSALAANDMSAAQIAERLGAPSRNAVIGFCHREKIQLTGKPIGGARSTKTRSDNVVPISVGKPRQTNPKLNATAAEVIVLDPPKKKKAKKKFGPVRIMDLPLFGRCRGPLNDDYRGVEPKKMMFCGEVTEPDSSWCKKCQAKYTTGHVKPNKLVDDNGNPIMSKAPKKRPFQRWRQ